MLEVALVEVALPQGIHSNNSRCSQNQWFHQGIGSSGFRHYTRHTPDFHGKRTEGYLAAHHTVVDQPALYPLIQEGRLSTPQEPPPLASRWRHSGVLAPLAHANW